MSCTTTVIVVNTCQYLGNTLYTVEMPWLAGPQRPPLYIIEDAPNHVIGIELKINNMVTVVGLYILWQQNAFENKHLVNVSDQF